MCGSELGRAVERKVALPAAEISPVEPVRDIAVESAGDLIRRMDGLGGRFFWALQGVTYPLEQPHISDVLDWEVVCLGETGESEDRTPDVRTLHNALSLPERHIQFIARYTLLENLVHK